MKKTFFMIGSIVLMIIAHMLATSQESILITSIGKVIFFVLLFFFVIPMTYRFFCDNWSSDKNYKPTRR